jgi:protein TonB
MNDPVNDPWMNDEEPARGRPRKLNRWVGRGALGLSLLVFVGMVAWGALSLVSESKTAKKQVVQVSLLRPPPPPPPPPPEQKPPEPEVRDEAKMSEPDPQPQQADEAPPPGEQLGLDADGSGNGDSFGLVGKKGGQDITTIGGGGGNGRARFAWFAGIVESQLQEHLHRNDKLRKSGYRVVMRVWFSDDGRMERYELIGSSGDPEVDRSLKVAMDDMPRLKQPPPPDLPQPIKLRVTARGAG